LLTDDDAVFHLINLASTLLTINHANFSLYGALRISKNLIYESLLIELLVIACDQVVHFLFLGFTCDQVVLSCVGYSCKRKKYFLYYLSACFATASSTMCLFSGLNQLDKEREAFIKELERR
jgi:hypothetical protein